MILAIFGQCTVIAASDKTTGYRLHNVRSTQKYIELVGWLLLFVLAVFVFLTAGGATVVPAADADPVACVTNVGSEAAPPTTSSFSETPYSLPSSR